MKTAFFFAVLIGITLGAVVAHFDLVGSADAQVVTDQFKTEQRPHNWQADQVMQQRLFLKGRFKLDGGCYGCQTGIGSTTYNFPAVSATNTAASTDAQCQRSWNVSAPGCSIGDDCRPSSNFGADGGAVLPAYVHLYCQVTAADTAVIDLCGQLNDGGTYDATDAGYTVRCQN